MPCVSVFQSLFENESFSVSKRQPQKKIKSWFKGTAYFLITDVVFLEEIVAEIRSLINTAITVSLL